MSRQYPIWNKVTSCIYKSPKHFGARDTSETEVRVGTSKSNSEFLVKHITTRRPHGDSWTVFTFGIADASGHITPLVRKYMHNKSHVWQDTDPLA